MCKCRCAELYYLYGSALALEAEETDDALFGPSVPVQLPMHVRLLSFLREGGRKGGRKGGRGRESGRESGGAVWRKGESEGRREREGGRE